jgi:LemA protein
MKKGTLLILVLLAIVLIGGCATCNVQRSLVSLDENVKAQFGQMQTQYQRRADLIPNLVSTVKGAAAFEQETLTEVINARSRATSIQVNPENLTPERLREFQSAQGELSQALGRLMVLTENYPQLRATESFRDLQVQLEGTENRIAVARRDYNLAVQSYNTKLRVFPNNIFGGMMGFEVQEMYQADAAAQRAPTVEF